MRSRHLTGIPAVAAVLACLFTAIPSTANAQVFNDVPPGYWAESFIEIVAANGVTGGCGGGNYCPDGTVTRAQMAVFLERSMRGGDFVPPAASGNMFLDVAANDFAANFIEQLALDGITGGCGGNNYCPQTPVSRAQMAVFLLRAKHGASYTPPAPSGVFSDVDTAHWAAGWIEQLAAEGITGGCGGGAYCPDNLVQRDQMAVFLVRAFDLVLPAADLTLKGLAVGWPMASANITATVFHAGSDGSTNTTYTATADALGAFSVGISYSNPDDLVVLTAQATGANQGVKLISYLGSAGYLAGMATGGPSSIDVADYGALELSHVTTAAGALAERSVGGPIRTAATFDEAQTKVVGNELLSVAAAIKAFIENPEITLPQGTSDSLELARDPFVTAGFLADLNTNFPVLLDAATISIADSLQQGFTVANVPGTRLLVVRDNVPLISSSYVLELNPDSSGTVVLRNGETDVTWSIRADGALIVDLLTPPVTESFPFVPEANTPDGQVRALTWTERLTVVPLAHWPASQQFVALERQFTLYPENPELPTETVEEATSAENVYLGIRSDTALGFSASEFSGAQIALPYFHQENNSPIAIDHQIGTDFFVFNGNGTGITSRRLLTFVWSIDSEGAVNIRFANGDENRVVRYSKDNIVNHTIVTGSLANGSRKVTNAETIEYDGSSEFSQVMLENRRYRYLGSIIDQEFDLDYLFLPGGAGCRITVFDGGTSVSDLPWTTTAANTMDSYRYVDFEPTIPLQRRSWELIAIETGQFGDRYWVIENLEHNGALDPSFDFRDPATTPGRINGYEFIQDLTGQTNPCPLQSPP
jgi:hypothetical protein